MLVICLIIVNRVHRIVQKETKEEVKPSEVRKKPKIGYGKSFWLAEKKSTFVALDWDYGYGHYCYNLD